MIRKSSTYQNGPSGIQRVDDRDEDAVAQLLVVRASADGDRDPSSSSIFQRPESPSERRWRSLVKSSRKPIAPQASIVPKIVSAGSVNRESTTNAIEAAASDQQAAHRRRSLLDGVPFRPLLADVLAELVLAQEGDEARPDEDRDDHRDDRRDQNSRH